MIFGRRVSAAIGATLLLASCTPVDTTAGGGTPAPDYKAVALLGDSVSLKDHRGQVVLLNIWATWCEPCREEMPFLQKVHQQHKDAGLRIVGVSIDARGEEARIKRFLSEFGVTFPIWLDPDDRASFLFRAIGVPASYLIARDGKVVWKHLGPISDRDTSFSAALARALRTEP